MYSSSARAYSCSPPNVKNLRRRQNGVDSTCLDESIIRSNERSSLSLTHDNFTAPFEKMSELRMECVNSFRGRASKQYDKHPCELSYKPIGILLDNMGTS